MEKCNELAIAQKLYSLYILLLLEIIQDSFLAVEFSVKEITRTLPIVKPGEGGGNFAFGNV